MRDIEEILHQVHDHARGWLIAGVEWLPLPSPLQEVATIPVETEGEAMLQSPDEIALFSESITLPMLDSEQKRNVCSQLVAEVAECTRCEELARTRTQTVFGVGSLDAELCFVGEAPGADEDARGEPFVGAAGQLLNKIILACGFSREEVYICNVLKCRPPGNRVPAPDEQANCRPFLERQLEMIRPKYICALGAVAAQWLTKSSVSIGKLRGKLHDYRGIPVLCTYHPAYLLRNPNAKRDVWEDMKFLLAKMGRPIPRS